MGNLQEGLLWFQMWNIQIIKNQLHIYFIHSTCTTVSHQRIYRRCLILLPARRTFHHTDTVKLQIAHIINLFLINFLFTLWVITIF